MHLLLIEDERKTASAIQKGLEEEGYNVDVAYDGEEGLRLIDRSRYNLVISDIIMPKVNGIELCKKVSESQAGLPVLLLTALSSKDDLVDGFAAGAYDYITKPFDFRELLARIKVLTRKTAIGQPEVTVLQYADVEMHLKDKRVVRAGKTVQLTAKEFNLLEYFMRRPETVIARAELARDIWNVDFNTWTNIVEVYINYLRNKVDKPFNSRLIHNVHGMGYIFKKADA
ncbi:MAG: response regulator transcription factor [Chitinophagales bacterium]